MAIKFNIDPYWDDFETATAVDGLSPKEKYNRILFRPGHAIQARELTQLQSILQNQVSSVGDHVFKEGSMVVPGGLSLHNKIQYLKVTTSVTTISSFIGVTVTDGTTNAKVIHAEAASGSDPVTLWVQYTSGPAFTSSASLTQSTPGTATVTEVGYGSLASIEDGIYYIKKNFVIVKSKTIVLSKYTSNVSYDIGLTITEGLVDSSADISLVDNAQGTPNESAPGAHRYSIKTVLSSQSVNSSTGNFVLLARLSSGKITKNVRHSQYSIIEETMARRTFDESGNYTVNPFPVTLKDHASDSTKVTLGLEPSKAYVGGYEIETFGITNVDIDRARDSELTTDKVVQIDNTSYLDVSGMTSYPNITSFEEITLKNGSAVTQGTCKVRSIQAKGTSTGSGAGNDYRIHIFDLQPAAGISAPLATATNITSSTSFATTHIDAYDITNEALVFSLPYSRVKTCNAVVDPLLTADYNYRFEANRILGTQTIASSSVTFTAQAANEVISAFDTTNWLLTKDSDGSVVTIASGDVTIDNSASTPQVTITNLSVTGDVTLIAKVVRTPTHKTKAKTSGSKSITPTNVYQDLDHCDVIGITTVLEGSTDVTEHFEFDSGQTASHYDVGKIRIKPTSNYSTTSSVTVTYDYLTHTSGDFFTVDSYDGQVDYEDIGKFGTIELRSAVDFRPRKGDAVDNFTGTNASTTVTPISATQFETDIQYYIDRIDQIYLDRDGSFGVYKGISAITPQPPSSPKNAMILYEMYIPAYTLKTTEVTVQLIDNRRYTMRDIGDIEKRLEQLDYYTSLSLLESQTAGKQILDASGNPKWKSGFLTDSFGDTAIGRVDHTEYRAGIDKEQGLLRPLFSEGNVGLNYNSSSSDTTITGEIVTLPYTSSALISQTQSSGVINVNPYNVFNWTGSIKLTPSSDEWKDIDTRPIVNFNGNNVFTALGKVRSSSTATGTVWNSWTTNWTGWRNNTTRVFNNNINGRAGIVHTTVGTRNQQRIRTGTTTTVSTFVGDRIVEVNFSPFMRSRIVQFDATRMRPATQVYAFFDEVDVSSWVNASVSSVVPSVGVNNLSAHPDGAATLTTDVNGALTGSFFVPNNATTQFRTGDKEFVLTDSSVNDKTDVGTFASSTYSAKGLIETHESITISTRRTETQRQDVAGTSQSRTSTRVQWIDPLAQSIMIDLQGGAFVTSLDLYFTSKDTAIPVQVQIREMLNGMPTQKVVPFSDVTLNPSSVNVDDTATTFTYESPVYLQDGVEYCFVVLANSNNYKVKVAEIGKDDESGNRISKQPYNGVMFKSQNGSTWTPDQNKDLMFVLNRAVFDTSVSRNIILENEALPLRALGSNPFSTTNSSATVIVEHPNHGMTTGESVTIAGTLATVYNIPISELNATHTISAVERDRYTITVTTNANATSVGGGLGITATQNVAWDSMYPLVQEVTLPNTSLGWGYSGRTLVAANNYASLPSTYTSLTVNSNYHGTTPSAILSGSGTSLKFKGTLSSTVDNLSPIVDMQRCSAIGISNRIDTPTSSNVADYYAETDSERGSALAKYVTKTVELTDSADELKLYMDINRPSLSDVEVYHKVGTSPASFDALPWTQITKTIPFTDDGKHNEVIFDFDSTGSAFTLFAIKIVMKSTSTTSIPSIRNFRAIATT